MATILEAKSPKSRKHFLINAVQISSVTITSLDVSPAQMGGTRLSPCSFFDETYASSVFKVLADLLQFAGCCVGIVGQVGEF